MRIKQTKFFFFEKKSKMAVFQKRPFFKIANSKNFFLKISQVRPWVSRIASCNPTNPMTNLWNFHKKILRIGDFEKWDFFESAILNFFFEKKKKNFASFPLKSAQIYMVEWMGPNFDVFPGFQKIPCYA